MYFRFYGRRHNCSGLLDIADQLAEVQRTRSLGLGYKLCAVIPVAGQRTHGTTFRTVKVTSQVTTPGAESAVCECLVRSGLDWMSCDRVVCRSILCDPIQPNPSAD